MKKTGMKKLAALALAAMMMTVFAGTAFAAQKVTLNQAKQIALRHVNLKAEEVDFTKARADREDGRKVFEIKFHKGIAKYEFEIDAATGAIRDFDIDYYDFD